MRQVDITAQTDEGGTVEIHVPRLTFEVDRRQAERLRDALNEVLAPASDGQRVGRTMRLLHLWDDVEPEITGPYATDKDRTEAAQDFRRAHGDRNGVYRVDVTGDIEADVMVESFTSAELAMPKPPRTPVEVGDRVRDPLDGEWREVVAVTGLAVRLADGGTMGIREAQEADKLLPSEELP